MNKILSTLALCCIALVAVAQVTVSGIVMDAEGESLIGANVELRNTSMGANTDIDGSFVIDGVKSGEYELVVSYIGYQNYVQAITVGNTDLDLGTLNVSEDAIGLQQVEIIASVAIDRKTPVAVSTISGETIEAKLGNREFPQILAETPSIYATPSGGGFGDARINVRGFDQRNTAVLINGIPVNDMENGWVYWSNWAGLSDVTRNMQVQRGLGASKLAISSVGGTINIITRTTDMRRGGSVFQSIGNDGYLKTGVTLSTGRTDDGWAFTFSGSRTTGDGYIDATYIDAWSYFASISKEISPRQQISLTAIGAPQRHGQRTFAEDLKFWDNAQSVFNRLEDTPQGDRANTDWGYKDGQVYNIRENYYHKPQIALNHFLDFTNGKGSLATSAYISFGRGGGTGDRGRIGGRGTWGFRDYQGAIRVDDIISWNRGVDNLEGFPSEGNTETPGIGFVGGERDGLIKRASVNNHNWYGVLSTLNYDLTPDLNLIAGIDGRYYRGAHYRVVNDLLGNDFYLEPGDVNRQNTSIDLDNDGSIGSKETGFLATNDDIIDYNNDGLVNWLGGFAQLEYDVTDDLTAFVTGSVSNTGYKRIDYFNYLDSDPEQETDWFNYVGYTTKAGANYNIDERNNVFFNAGYFSRAPLFDALFPNFTNDANADAENEKVAAVEVGYGYRARRGRLNVNLYHTRWLDRTYVYGYNDELGNRFTANILGLNATHQGIELEGNIRPTDNLTLRGSFGIGDWRWTNNVEAILQDENNDPVDTLTVFAQGLKVGDAAQTTAYAGVSYRIPSTGLTANADLFYYGNLYADFDPTTRQSPSVVQPLELNATNNGYGLLNLGISYNLKLQGDMSAVINANVYNVTNERYVAEGQEPTDSERAAIVGDKVDDFTDAEMDALQSEVSGYYGFGRTWSLSFRVIF